MNTAKYDIWSEFSYTGDEIKESVFEDLISLAIHFLLGFSCDAKMIKPTHK